MRARIVFFDELRLGVEPALARVCLRRPDAGRLTDAARDRVRNVMSLVQESIA